jgi:hypothetical protein
MGFITDKADSSTSTFSEREDVESWVHEFADEQGWDLSDVRNRAIMYYAMKYRKGELDDPVVDYNVDDKAKL